MARRRAEDSQMSKLTPKQEVLLLHPSAICRKGMFAAKLFNVFPESYKNGFTGKLMVSGKHIGTGWSSKDAWADAARRIRK